MYFFLNTADIKGFEKTALKKAHENTKVIQDNIQNTFTA